MSESIASLEQSSNNIEHLPKKIYELLREEQIQREQKSDELVSVGTSERKRIANEFVNILSRKPDLEDDYSNLVQILNEEIENDPNVAIRLLTTSSRSTIGLLILDSLSGKELASSAKLRKAVFNYMDSILYNPIGYKGIDKILRELWNIIMEKGVIEAEEFELAKTIINYINKNCSDEAYALMHNIYLNIKSSPVDKDGKGFFNKIKKRFFNSNITSEQQTSLIFQVISGLTRINQTLAEEGTISPFLHDRGKIFSIYQEISEGTIKTGLYNKSFDNELIQNIELLISIYYSLYKIISEDNISKMDIMKVYWEGILRLIEDYVIIHPNIQLRIEFLEHLKDRGEIAIPILHKFLVERNLTRKNIKLESWEKEIGVKLKALEMLYEISKNTGGKNELVKSACLSEIRYEADKRVREKAIVVYFDIFGTDSVQGVGVFDENINKEELDSVRSAFIRQLLLRLEDLDRNSAEQFIKNNKRFIRDTLVSNIAEEEKEKLLEFIEKTGLNEMETGSIFYNVIEEMQYREYGVLKKIVSILFSFYLIDYIELGRLLDIIDNNKFKSVLGIIDDNLKNKKEEKILIPLIKIIPSIMNKQALFNTDKDICNIKNAFILHLVDIVDFLKLSQIFCNEEYILPLVKDNTLPISSKEKLLGLVISYLFSNNSFEKAGTMLKHIESEEFALDVLLEYLNKKISEPNMSDKIIESGMMRNVLPLFIGFPPSKNIALMHLYSRTTIPIPFDQLQILFETLNTSSDIELRKNISNIVFNNGLETNNFETLRNLAEIVSNKKYDEKTKQIVAESFDFKKLKSDNIKLYKEMIKNINQFMPVVIKQPLLQKIEITKDVEKVFDNNIANAAMALIDMYTYIHINTTDDDRELKSIILNELKNFLRRDTKLPITKVKGFMDNLIQEIKEILKKGQYEGNFKVGTRSIFDAYLELDKEAFISTAKKILE